MKRIRAIAIVLFCLVCTPVVMAGKINKSFLKGIAIEGYDPVGYFLENRALKGNPNISFKWQDAVWYFVSSANRDLFAADPIKYAPQYGGHCANGMSEGHKVSGNPEIWRMIAGKLYFFYAQTGRDRWATNTDQWIEDANRNWERLQDE